MSLSLRQLRTPIPEDVMLEGCLGILDSLGFQATSWQSTSASRIAVQLIAKLASDVTYAIADISGSMHAGLASGAYADDLGQGTFNLTRVQATQATGVMLLTSSAAAPIQSWAVNDLLIADSELDGARTFVVTSAGTINPGTSVPVSVIASVPGSGSNIPPNIATMTLRTPLIGVTVTNPPQPPTTPVNTWIIYPGSDAESDGPGGRYNARMIGRWSRLSYGNTEGAYGAWCFEALPALTRLSVRNGATEGSIHIVGATAVSGLSGAQTGFYPAPMVGTGQVGTILDYLTGAVDGVGRRPINDALEVVSANQLTTPPLGVNIVVSSPFSADAVARVTAALTSYIQTIPIGGVVLPGASSGVVLRSDLYAVVMAQQGVVNVTFSFAGDVALSTDDIWTPSISVSMIIAP
jgi:hypothetical protein